jgi:hypothetical protein
MRRHRLSFCWAVALAAAVGSAFAGTATVVGDWEAALDTGSGTLRVVIHISQGKDESLTGTLDSPDQGARGIAISAVNYKEPDVHLTVERIGASYDGKINKDNSELSGEWKQGGGSAPLTFKRVVK